MKRVLLVLGSAVLAGCYNNPKVTERPPGAGPQYVHAGPAVGPGTTPGGSTAGPQRPRREQNEEAEAPRRAESLTDSKGLGHMGAAGTQQTTPPANAPAGAPAPHAAEKDGTHGAAPGKEH